MGLDSVEIVFVVEERFEIEISDRAGAGASEGFAI